MKFNDSFWLAVAAASPVIALANTVLIGDAVTTWWDVKVRQRPRFSAAICIASLVCSGLNLFIQALVFAAALHFLDKRRVSDVAGFFAGAELFGLVLVFLSVALNAVLKHRLRRQEDRETANQRHPSSG